MCVIVYGGGGGLHITQLPPHLSTEAKFVVPDWGINYSRLLHSVAIPTCQPMYPGRPARQPNAGVDYIPQSGTKSQAGRYDNPMSESAIHKIIRILHFATGDMFTS